MLASAIVRLRASWNAEKVAKEYFPRRGKGRYLLLQAEDGKVVGSFIDDPAPFLDDENFDGVIVPVEGVGSVEELTYTIADTVREVFYEGWRAFEEKCRRLDTMAILTQSGLGRIGGKDF
ncbi:MAG: hypothetical protein PWP65_2100 [Clostridia bacterium]|nr:hypothetical protein [Clostridia bacterium]